MVANDGYGVYEIIVAFAHIAFVALLLGSALTNIFRFPWFIYADEPRAAVQRGVGIAELLLAAVVCLPYFWGQGSSVAALIALAYGLAVGVLALLTAWRVSSGSAPWWALPVALALFWLGISLLLESWPSAGDARALEPALHCVAALLSPSTGIIDSHTFMLALRGDAERTGILLGQQRVRPDRGSYASVFRWHAS